MTFPINTEKRLRRYFKYYDRQLDHFFFVNELLDLNLRTHDFDYNGEDLDYFSIQPDMHDIEPSPDYSDYVRYSLNDMSFDDFNEDYREYYGEAA